MNPRLAWLAALAWTALIFPALGATTNAPTPADKALADYFRAETERLSSACLADIKTLDDWTARRDGYRHQLLEMLSLQPLPAREPLHAAVTGNVVQEDFTVQNIQFQSLPGLYVTANLYLPKNPPGPLPAILYLSGHGPVISNGVSYGNKVTYQHHGAWFARHGYACLILDTLQLGEIQGLHHGTYRDGLWWWNARGYTPAGVEAWNSMRALDYLESRPEIDRTRLGATGRSGGGAYSWWIAALDDRIKAVAPVAGITDLQNHVVDGAVEGHCDCMFTVNTYRWDYPQVAALVAPRPLLIVNTDSDSIFPLDGVQRLHAKVRRVYELHNAASKLGLVIGPGPHKDTQDLQVPVFRWFNQHLKGTDPLIAAPAEKRLAAHELKVFPSLPADAINTNIQESFVPAAPPPALPASVDGLRIASRLSALSNACFAGWPAAAPALRMTQAFAARREGVAFEAWDFTSQDHVRLRLYLAQKLGDRAPVRIELAVLDATNFARFVNTLRPVFAGELGPEAALGLSTDAGDTNAFAALRDRLGRGEGTLAWMAPRGIGLTAWDPTPRKQVHIRRRFMLLGQTLDSMRVWDIRRAVQATHSVRGTATVEMAAEGPMAVNALYAALFETSVTRLELSRLPASHRKGPDYLNVLRYTDVPEVLGWVASRMPVALRESTGGDWTYPAAVAALAKRPFVIEGGTAAR